MGMTLTAAQKKRYGVPVTTKAKKPKKPKPRAAFDSSWEAAFDKMLKADRTCVSWHHPGRWVLTLQGKRRTYEPDFFVCDHGTRNLALYEIKCMDAKGADKGLLKLQWFVAKYGEMFANGIWLVEGGPGKWEYTNMLAQS